ncbi:MAG: hypothetical protein QOJ26_583 [Thermoplasmata archaeon]|nr:hypothetical protein [Thermoplasmata archaeon]
MDWLDLLDAEQAAQKPWVLLILLVGVALWLVGFSRKKILQDLDILERIKPLDPKNQAAPAIRASLGFWIKAAYGWPRFIAFAFFVLGTVLAYAAASLLALAWEISSPAVGFVAALAALEAMACVLFAWMRQKSAGSPHAVSLQQWKP